MFESTGGFEGVSAEVTLDQLAREDAARIARQARRQTRVARRNGRHGSTVWGYAPLGTGKRGQRRV